MIRCRLLGHRYRFTSDGDTMRWQCERCGGVGGTKRCPTTQDAARYAAALDREDRADLGRRAPYIGLFPLRLWRAITKREHRS